MFQWQAQRHDTAVDGPGEAAGSGSSTVQRLKLLGTDFEALVDNLRYHGSTNSYDLTGERVLEVWANDTAYEFRQPLVQQWASQGAALQAGGQTVSPMPGRVIKVPQLWCKLTGS